MRRFVTYDIGKYFIESKTAQGSRKVFEKMSRKKTFIFTNRQLTYM